MLKVHKIYSYYGYDVDKNKVCMFRQTNQQNRLKLIVVIVCAQYQMGRHKKHFRSQIHMGG